MAISYLVRVGTMGNVGRFCSTVGERFTRGARVILRTARGLETGDILINHEDCPPADADGVILRGMTVEDELLAARQAKNRDAAYEACRRRIDEAGLPVALMDVEHLFDGQNLVFYFLGDTDGLLDDVLAELTELYEAKVQFRKFAEAVENGCGPGCGTDAATGAGCGSCATGCTLSAACGSHKHAP